MQYKIAKLSPKALKKAAKSPISSEVKSCEIKIAKLLARPIKLQLEKLEIFIKTTSINNIEVVYFLLLFFFKKNITTATIAITTTLTETDTAIIVTLSSFSVSDDLGLTTFIPQKSEDE